HYYCCSYADTYTFVF
nr:immunoglobulin light chain junction region [Macaca mulatta]MOV73518.1 immunoglobulin light chain junction region [Macaca mulatta]MOV74181.1 immunoglobulin light chain junction region [Macaca mulatta]